MTPRRGCRMTAIIAGKRISRKNDDRSANQALWRHNPQRVRLTSTVTAIVSISQQDATHRNACRRADQQGGISAAQAPTTDGMVKREWNRGAYLIAELRQNVDGRQSMPGELLRQEGQAQCARLMRN